MARVRDGHVPRLGRAEEAGRPRVPAKQGAEGLSALHNLWGLSCFLVKAVVSVVVASKFSCVLAYGARHGAPFSQRKIPSAVIFTQ